MKSKKTKQITDNGGSNAMKGFIYQFDKSLIEVLNNPSSDCTLECIEDFGYENYYIQIKNNESQKFTNSKIKKPVIKILREFERDKTKSFCLYCHFADKKSEKINLTISQLNKILSNNKKDFTAIIKKEFINKFIIEFSPNYKKQFIELINKIKKSYNTKKDDEAIIYHSILNFELQKIAIKKNANDRKINKKHLDKLIENSNYVFSCYGYYEYLKKEKYLKHIKKEFFTFKKVNIPNENRLFIVCLDDDIKDPQIIQIINNIQKKYFVLDHSPAPYVCLWGIKDKRINGIKQKMCDKGNKFTDGTFFNGDRFRIDVLVKDTNIYKNEIPVKILGYKTIDLLQKKMKLDEVFIFYKTDYFKIKSNKQTKINYLYINNSVDILKLIN